MQDLFFQGWFILFRTVLIGVLAYFSLVLILRVSGRRTLSKMNAFDFVVTVALGSTLATILLNRNVALAEGVVAFMVLVGLQYAVTWTSVRVSWVRKKITGEPLMLLYHGAYLEKAMLKSRITHAEVDSAVRSAGLTSLQQARAVILETDGSFNVVKDSRDDVDYLAEKSSLARVKQGK